MELTERLADVRRRPSVYGIATFGEMVAFLTGVDAATEWQFLDGFREWLAAKSSLGANLAWPVLLIRIAYPEESNDFWVSALRQESGEAVAVLFAELDAFLASKRASDEK